jgi:hypothetical protein
MQTGFGQKSIASNAVGRLCVPRDDERPNGLGMSSLHICAAGASLCPVFGVDRRPHLQCVDDV